MNELISLLSQKINIFEKDERDGLYCYIVSHQKEMLKTENQEYIINNWWGQGGLATLVQDDLSEYLDNDILFHCFDWNKIFHVGANFNANGEDTAKCYRGAEISWFNLGLLSHWSLLRTAIPYIEPNCVNVINSLGQNSLHVMAQSFKQCPREDYQDIFQYIVQHKNFSVLELDNQGRSIVDIVKSNLTNIKEDTIRANTVIKVNNDFLMDIEKLIFNEQLNNNLAEKTGNKKNKI